jgi:hypothetical protein
MFFVFFVAGMANLLCRVETPIFFDEGGLLVEEHIGRRRHGVNSDVGCEVGRGVGREPPSQIFFVESKWIVRNREEWLQHAAPGDTFRAARVKQRPRANEISSQQEGAIEGVPDRESPVTD